ncbi:MAG: PadR family transcriptional regulator, partial [Dehalococcoidia bacterium]
YPALRRLVRDGLIIEEAEEPSPADGPVGGWARRSRRRVYRLTAEGKERFAEMLADAGPETWEDDSFGIHLTFFSRTPAETRMRILEGRRRRVEERREGLRETLTRAAERLDAYTLELQRHGFDACDREVRWLEELIANERDGQPPTITTVEPGVLPQRRDAGTRTNKSNPESSRTDSRHPRGPERQ